MEKRTCAADDCDHKFTPKIPEQKYCSNKCASRIRVRLMRARRRCQLSPPPGGGGGGMSLDFHGEGISIRREDDALPVIGPKPSPERKPPVPANPQPQRSHAHVA